MGIAFQVWIEGSCYGCMLKYNHSLPIEFIDLYSTNGIGKWTLKE
jgi:hypothetical protein